jgi:hypothetical protein
MPTVLPSFCSGTMRADRISVAWFSRTLSITLRSTLNSVSLTFWILSEISAGTAGALLAPRRERR